MTQKNIRFSLLIIVFTALFTIAACQRESSSGVSTATNGISGDEPATPAVNSAELNEKMYQLIEFSSRSDIEAVINDIVAENNSSFIPVFIELLRANQIGLLPFTTYTLHLEALEMLSGENFDGDWASWVEWYGGTDILPPAGFIGWKGKLLGQIDPGFEEFLQDEYASTIRVEEIMWGGVSVDGIPALINPSMLTAEEADYITQDEPVFGIAINGEARAYPLRILDWHEMANDIVGGVPISLAYCTLCGAGIAFDGRTPDAGTYTFGSSGFLFRSNKLMYDHQTRSLWNQLTGEPVLGELVEKNIVLSLLPLVLTSWGDWHAQHPDTLVLDIVTGYDRDYALGAAYGSYFSSEDTMFPVWKRSDLLDDKHRIYALRINGVPKAYPIDILTEEQIVNDTLGGTNLVLIAAHGQVIVDSEGIDFSQGGLGVLGGVRYSAGAEVRAYQRNDDFFQPSLDPNVVLDSAGQEWTVSEEALIGPDGEMLPRINGHLAYWFGWFSFFPNTEVYTLP